VNLFKDQILVDDKNKNIRVYILPSHFLSTGWLQLNVFFHSTITYMFKKISNEAVVLATLCPSDKFAFNAKKSQIYWERRPTMQ
jgi:hypothetical protein